MECFKAGGVEFGGGFFPEDGEDLVGRETGAVGTVLRERAIDVGDGDDTVVEGEVGGGEAVGVARAVEALVMTAGDGGDGREGGDTGEDPL